MVQKNNLSKIFALFAIFGGDPSLAIFGAEPSKDPLGTITLDHGQFSEPSPRKKNLKSFKTSGPHTIHIVPHSHDDVGWRKTVDGYFDGSDKPRQWTNVKVELDSIIASLVENPDRKFSQVEMKFFTMWWDLQTDEMKQTVKKLVANGQLEMINGGWSMHDEATTNYEDMIDNMMIGHDFILKEFGVKPNIGWQIDPFGHSATNARIFAEMGFDAFFSARMDFGDKEMQKAEKSLEALWIPYKNSLGEDVKILHHLLYAHYCAPSGMGFDVGEGDTWYNNKKSQVFNADQKAIQLDQQLQERIQYYRTNDIIVLMGCDFQYMNAHQNYGYLDNMIEYMNANYNDTYVFKYSTPGTYIKALQAANITWPVREGDGFPYADDQQSYWTGFFTSRPNLKAYVISGSRIHHSSNQLYSKQMLRQNDQDINLTQDASYTLSDVMGVLQHHDAVAGTCDDDVASDYAIRLGMSIQANKKAYYNEVEKNMQWLTGYVTNEWSQCDRLNSSWVDCPVFSKDDNQASKPEYFMNVAVFNPSSVDVNYSKVQVPHGKYKVEYYNLTIQKWIESKTTQVHCFDDHLDDQNQTPFNNCIAHVPVSIKAKETQLLKFTQDKSRDLQVKTQTLTSGQAIENSKYKLVYQKESQEPKNATFQLIDKYSGSVEKITISLKDWISAINFNRFKDTGVKTSGIYIFNPKADVYQPQNYGQLYKATYSQGSDQFGQFNFYFNQESDVEPGVYYQQSRISISLDHDQPVIQVDVDLDSLPNVYQFDGNEVVVQFKVDNFDNNQTFFTDSNGLEMQRRVLNYREDWDLQYNYKLHNDNITANFYPINSAISMKDINTNRKFTVMNERSQSGSSLFPGEIELMQNRAIPGNDGKGEDGFYYERNSFNRGIRVPASYYVQIFDEQKNISVQRTIQQIIADGPQYFFAFEEEIFSVGQKSTYSIDLKNAGVIDPIKIVTIPRGVNQFDLRVENIADYYDASTTGQTFTVNVTAIVEAFWKEANLQKPTVGKSTITEMSLTGNMELKDMIARKIQWISDPDESILKDQKQLDYSFVQGEPVTMEPQRIRVFSVQYSVSESENFLI